MFLTAILVLVAALAALLIIEPEKTSCYTLQETSGVYEVVSLDEVIFSTEDKTEFHEFVKGLKLVLDGC